MLWDFRSESKLSYGTTLKLFDTKTTESASFYLDKGKYYIRIENYVSVGNALYDLKVSGKKAHFRYFFSKPW